MKWNWQQKNWPQFQYEEAKLSDYEMIFREKAAMVLGSIKHLDKEDQETLKIDLISDEALKTSEIEQEFLNRDSLQSSIREHFGLKTDARRVTPSEYGISEMMVDLYKTYQVPLRHQQLFNWHLMLTNGRRDLTDMGRYRTHTDAMQITSGRLDRPKVYFEAPPSSIVKKEMNQFIDWFNLTAKGAKREIGALIRSGIAHLYFESIHPFEDGNGRIGRAISEKALSQSLDRPTLIAISHTIQRSKKNYYDALHQNSLRLEITDWLQYFCEIVLQAQDYTQSMIDFLIKKGKFYHRFQDKLNDRQEKVIQRIFREGIDGFKGGLSAENYIRINRTSRQTASRDLTKLVELGALIKRGEGKGTRYYLNIDHESTGGV